MSGSIDNAGAILLAAGASTRLGQPKQLLPFRGGTLLGHVCRMARAAGCAPVVVVLGAEAARCAAALRKEVPADNAMAQTVECAAWVNGMGASLKAGLRALCDLAPACAEAVVLLCDQPLVTPDLLRALLHARRTRGAPAAACRYDGTVGPPAVFGREIFSEIAALPDAAGARSLLTRHAAAGTLACVDFPDGTLDVDTPADAARLRE
ncbi:MAG: nucleotidyltransferase family protein [Verrucomicrobia bacterium]|nr:nucleotidyltransferase family protein [Verrucomicrobiota bacterium]